MALKDTDDSKPEADEADNEQYRNGTEQPAEREQNQG